MLFLGHSYELGRILRLPYCTIRFDWPLKRSLLYVMVWTSMARFLRLGLANWLAGQSPARRIDD